MNLEPIWLLPAVVEKMHAEQLAAHGGAVGTRAPELLESALGRPRNLFAYGQSDVFDLAASYAYGLARNHPFVDGNKRTAFLAAYTFLRLNGQRLEAKQVDVVSSVLALAEGALAEEAFAAWLRANAKP